VACTKSRTPVILPVGLTTANYRREPSTRIRRLGYFGRMSRSDHGGLDLKRGYLAQEVAARTGLEFYQRENLHFLAADQLYQSVDLVMFCSTTEGNPYVALEAAAAGVPTLGTPVGIFPALATNGAGILLPLDPAALVEEAVRRIEELQHDHDTYLYMSHAAQRNVAAFNWSQIRKLWMDEFKSACTDGFKQKDSHVFPTKKVDLCQTNYVATYSAAD
jgi:glycosyltransferase involved in cell wall biosynthesis